MQEVFLTRWRNAGRFDSERRTVRSWVLQIAHFRILNELRRQSRQPAIAPDPEGAVFAGLPSHHPGPAEAAWQRHRSAVLKSALDELPPPQREALGLAFLNDLTHEQVAAKLGVPLGTTKTRIRAGLQGRRGKFGPRGAALAESTRTSGVLPTGRWSCDLRHGPVQQPTSTSRLRRTTVTAALRRTIVPRGNPNRGSSSSEEN